MLGDDIEADIAGAQRAGLHTALVKTGKFRPADLDGPVAPDVTLDSVASLPAWWRGR
jgi:phospholysine phosphohistidine inorganic pyrophosphate phosphatase